MTVKLKVELLEHTPNPEKLIAAAAKLCYSPVGVSDIMEDLTEDKIESFVNKLMSMGHESPIEHVSFTFGIEDVSRFVEQQLTRHRIASYSIQSGRYVKRDDPGFVTPVLVANSAQALEIYLDVLTKATEAYIKIYNILMREQIVEFLQNNNIRVTEWEISTFEQEHKTEYNKFEKKAIENARYVYPQSLATKIVVTMNARSLFNFFKHRCCTRAQDEIRDVADVMLDEAKKVAPILFKYAGPNCVCGMCPEGKMTCGRMKEMREKYLLKSE